MTKNLVEIVRFCANDETGAYCKALILQHNGKEIYLAHRGSIDADFGQNGYVTGSARYVYHKREFPSEQELQTGFPYFTSQNSEWQPTDSGLGYNIPEQAQAEALQRYRAKEDKKWEQNRTESRANGQIL